MSLRPHAFLATLLVLIATPSYGDIVVSGSFTMSTATDSPGQDLLAILDHENSFTATFTGETWSCVADNQTVWCPCMALLMSAASFEIEFFGPDAELLNEVVGAQLGRGGIEADAYLSITHTIRPNEFFDMLRFYFLPEDETDGVAFFHFDTRDTPYMPIAADGCPTVAPFVTAVAQTVLHDGRGSNNGSIWASVSSLQLSVPPTASETTSWGRVKSLYR